MARCSCGPVAISCRCGCGCICTVERRPRCYIWCEECPRPWADGLRSITIGLASFIAPSGEIPKLSGNTEVKLNCKQMALGSLALALDMVAEDAVCAPVDRLGEKVTVATKGKLSEILDRLGLTSAKRSKKK